MARKENGERKTGGKWKNPSTRSLCQSGKTTLDADRFAFATPKRLLQLNKLYLLPESLPHHIPTTFLHFIFLRSHHDDVDDGDYVGGRALWAFRG